MSALPEPPPWSRPPQGWGSGMVTRASTPFGPPDYPGQPAPGGPGTPPGSPGSPGTPPGSPGSPGTPPGSPPGSPRAPGGRPPADRRRLLIFGGAAGAVLAIGLIVVLFVTLSGGVDPVWNRPPAPRDVRPPLARACAAATAPAEPEPTVTAPAGPSQGAPGSPRPGASAGPRTVDAETGISYKAYGKPWQPWNTVWRAGTLQVPYGVGQHFVTENYSGGMYHASILSGAVPAADNDAVAINLECVGRQVAADVRAEYYPQPNRAESIRDNRATLGGRPAWVTVFRLHFREKGLRATDELAAVATIDVGRPDAAILYISIPGTHRRFDYVVEDVLASVGVP